MIKTHSGKTRLAGVLGWPVSHSLSPRLHGFWLEEHGIDGAYLPLAVSPDDFPDVVRALAKCGFAGANVTIPHKEAALALSDEIDAAARRIGAVNTLKFEADGRILGSNTDGFGFLENLRHGAPAWRADAGPALILGAGGAARAVCVALLDAGAPQLRLTNRTVERAEALAAEIGGSVEVVPWDDRALALGGAALLVNTTALGMEGQASLEMALDDLPRDALVTDIVYAPLVTRLLADAKTRGHPVVDGLGMLLHQGRPGFEAWFGHAPEVTAELRQFVLSGLDRD